MITLNMIHAYFLSSSLTRKAV